MKKLGFICAAVLVIHMVPAAARAGVHFSAVGMTPDPSNPRLFKTPPMEASDNLTIQWAVHTKYTATHWAGVRFRAHVIDPNEVDLLGMTIYAGYLPQQTITGPGAGAPASSAITGTYWDPNATQSGIFMGASAVFTFGQWTMHVNGSDPADNSDSDLGAAGSSIFHVGSTPVVTLTESNYVWATSSFEPVPGEPFPEDAPYPDDPNGHWVHVGFTTTWPVPGWSSGFYTKPIAGVWLGIEHVPEASTGLTLLAGGCVALLGRRRARRRRL
jgi:hypothetical protein